MADGIIGSVGVAVTPNAERFWEDFKAKTQGGAENAAPTVRVKADTSEFDRKLDEVKARAALADTTVKVKADTSQATFQMHLLADAIIALGPATVPVAGVLSGALLGLGPAAGAAVLGVTGVINELKSGALVGTQFGATLTNLGNQFQGLQHTAADGLLTGLQASLGTLNPIIGVLSAQIGRAAQQLGTAFAAALPGILTILKQLDPLFVTFGNLLVEGAQKFSHWAQSSSAVTQFVNYVKAELPLVGHFIAELVTLVSHLVQSFAPLGTGVLGSLNILIGAINAIPVNVLQELVPLATAGYFAFRAYSGLSVVAATLNTVTAAIKGMGTVTTESAIAARAAELTETQAAGAKARAITVAAQATIAASRAEIAATDAAAAASVAASERTIAATELARSFIAGDATATEAASARLVAAKDAEAAAIASAADKEAASVTASALVVSSAADAEAASIQAAGDRAAVGWGGFIPIVGAAVVGIGLLTSLLGSNASASKAAAEAQNSYATSVQKSTDALNTDNQAQTNSNLSKAHAFTQLDQLNAKNKDLALSSNDLTLAVNGNNVEFTSVIDKLKAVAAAHTQVSTTGRNVTAGISDQSTAANDLINTLTKYRTGLTNQILTQTQLNSANAASLSITDQQASAAASLYGLVGDKGVAAYLAAKAGQQQLTDQTQTQTAAFQQQNDVAGLLAQALDKLAGKQLSNAEAQNAFEQALVNMATKISKADAAVVGLSSSAVKNRGELLGAVKSAETLAGTYGNLDGTSQAAITKLTALRLQIIANAHAHGENTVAVTKFVDSVLTIPKFLPPIKAELDTKQALAAKKDLQAQIDALKQGKPPVITVDTSGATNAIYGVITLIRGLNGAITSQVGAGASTVGSISRLHPASGGYITGAGTGTSDSIPAMISNGEYVINAAQTAKHKDLLNAINKGAQGFADGGIVTLTPPHKSSSGGTHAKTSSSASGTTVTITADGGYAYGFADVIKGNIGQARAATAELSQAVNDAFQLKGVQAKLALVTSQLKNLQQASDSLRSGVQTSLSSSVDVSKYADVGGLLSALGNQTGSNSKFTGELNKLSKEGVDKNLLAKLAAAGPSAGLDTLAGASASQIKQINSAFGSYLSSANSAGTFAASDVYGTQIGADKKLVASLTTQQKGLTNNIDKLVSVVAKMTGRPVEVKLDGKVLATAVFKSKQFDGVLDGITHALVYR